MSGALFLVGAVAQVVLLRRAPLEVLMSPVPVSALAGDTGWLVRLLDVGIAASFLAEVTGRLLAARSPSRAGASDRLANVLAVARDLVVDVTSWSRELMEARGSGSNTWLRDPDNGLWLYKATRTARATGVLQGEDWAEKAVERLAALIGIPTAQVELATVDRGDELEWGVISKNLATGGFELQGGATLLADVPGYRYRDSRGRPPRNRVGHSVPVVREQLARFGVAPPSGFEPAFMTAFDLFGGYLLLDAWIGNQDRHEENWAVLRDEDAGLFLAPSFDHGASLGFVLTEDQRTSLVRDHEALRAYAAKGFAKRFENCAKVPLTVVAADALVRGTARAKDVWLSRLAAVRADDCHRELAGVPRMSDVSRTFCVELLEINRRRLLDECR